MFLAGLLSLVSTVVDRIIPDKVKAAEAKLELAKLEIDSELQQMVGQLKINANEGSHPSIFVAGWRPFIGWVCGIAFAYHFLLLPLILLLAASAGYDLNLPVFSMEALMTVLLGMLGLGGMRTYEKFKGVANSFMKKETEAHVDIPEPANTGTKKKD